MSKPELNPEAVEAAAKAEYPHLFNGKMEKGLASIERLFTPEQAHESAAKKRVEKAALIFRHARAYLSALPAQSVQAIVAKQQLMDQPIGTILRGSDGTVACRATEERGVVFGDERTFPWEVLPLPAFIMPLPEVPA